MNEPTEQTDPVLEALDPAVGTEPDAGTNDDPRDAFFQSENEQTYSAPSAPLLDPPVKKDPEAQQAAQENAAKAKALGPLI
jgi:hypothetical protein